MISWDGVGAVGLVNITTDLFLGVDFEIKLGRWDAGKMTDLPHKKCNPPPVPPPTGD